MAIRLLLPSAITCSVTSACEGQLKAGIVSALHVAQASGLMMSNLFIYEPVCFAASLYDETPTIRGTN